VPPAASPPAAQEPVREAAAPDRAGARYTIRADASDVRFLVYRAGRLAALGHNHVVQAGRIEGTISVAPEVGRSSFAILMPVADFVVDAPVARAEEGAEFATQPGEDAVAGTRRNMLGAKVLDAEHFPRVEIRSVSAVGPPWAPDVTVRIRLRGVERELTVPVAVAMGQDRLVATAVFEIRQSDFGIEPLSVLGGALQVADVVRVRMRLAAERASIGPAQ
jgi:polyisoprenoid-binding protein YceI